MTASSSPDPAPHDPGLRVEGSSPDGLGGRTSTTATPQWTWTDEARDAVLISAWGVRPGEAWTDDRASADAVLAVLSPHVARQVADLTAERDELRRLVAGLEAENDNYHADLIRVIGEREAALAKVDAVEALHQGDGFASCRHCGYIWPCPTYRALAADSQQPVLPPEDAQEPQTPAPGSPGTPGTLSVPLSAPQDPHGA